MWAKETKPECCIDYEPLPYEIECMAPDICNELACLFRQNRQAFTKNSRIIELAKAKPRARTNRFLNKCPCFFEKNIEVIRLDQKINTRTEQLAYPRARNLLTFKQEIRKLFTPDRILNLNRLIRKSLFSLYSRLGNVQPPAERKAKVIWVKEDWQKHTRKLKKLAKPKKIITPPKKPSKRRPLSEMKRYKSLAKPKKCRLIEKADWMLTPEMRKHIASERTLALAKPIYRDTTMLYQELPIQVPPLALKHKASERIGKLAKPNVHKIHTGPVDVREDPFAVSPNALKAKASKRTEDLAEPREYENIHIRDDPYAISKAALKAKAKPRTIELAKPRKR